MARDAPAPSDKGRSLVWMQGLACGACAAVAPAACGMLGILLGPAIVALLLDRIPGKPIARAMLLCGAAACVGPLMTVWRTGSATAMSLAGDFSVCGPAWAACAAGWILSQILPIAIRGVLEASSLSRTAKLRAERERLLNVWGLEDH